MNNTVEPHYRSYFLCDIDGTIADCNDRLHFVKTVPKNWKAFMLASQDDPVIPQTAAIIKGLMVLAPWQNIVFLTARNEAYRSITETWLRTKFFRSIEIGTRYHPDSNGENFKINLYMRPNNDYRPDYEVKKDIYLEHIRPTFGNATKIFDDKKEVIDTFTELGVFSLKVGTEARIH